MRSDAMRWGCEQDGCFLEKCVLSFDAFARCFRRGINFTDLDGLVEISGFMCMMEWKAKGAGINKGQAMAFERITARTVGNCVFLVSGDPETMSVESYRMYWNGKLYDEIHTDIEGLADKIKMWAEWADGHPRDSNLRLEPRP
jgi:hypothetical protein